MTYKVIGIMSGSSLDGLDVACVELQEQNGVWNFNQIAGHCFTYSANWMDKLRNATALSLKNYLTLHVEFGKYIADCVNTFISKNRLEHQIQLLSVHGHTCFHEPPLGFSTQLGCGATIAAATQLNVVADLRTIDIANGGEGAPLVPIGDFFLFSNYGACLNIGGIANISILSPSVVAGDIAPANTVLNYYANRAGKAFDEDGHIASTGQVFQPLLNQLNDLAFYKKHFPKSLNNEFSKQIVIPLINTFQLSTPDNLCTYSEHLAQQVGYTFNQYTFAKNSILITGGGAFNVHLMKRISFYLSKKNIQIDPTSPTLVNYKEAIVMAFIGLLRWREQNTVLPTTTGARKPSIGGAVWMGLPA